LLSVSDVEADFVEFVWGQNPTPPFSFSLTITNQQFGSFSTGALSDDGRDKVDYEQIGPAAAGAGRRVFAAVGRRGRDWLKALGSLAKKE
jgi:hypothetical protein